MESSKKRALSPTIIALGCVSLCTDFATKMVYPIVPLYLTTVLDSPALAVGIIEGLAESSSSILKLYSGAVSDRIGKRKPLAIFGYGLGAISKLLLATSYTWILVLGARLIDRVGKGFRAAPRDVLIVENSDRHQRGSAFGLHHSLESIGEILGPLLAFFLILEFSFSYQNIFAIAFIPAVIGVLVLLIFVKEPSNNRTHPKALPFFTLKGVSPEYLKFLIVVTIFTLGNSSDAFIMLRVQDIGYPSHQIVLMYALLNIVKLFISFPAGKIADALNPHLVLIVGYGIFSVVYLAFSFIKDPSFVLPLIILYGVYIALTKGTEKAILANVVRPQNKGQEIGTFQMIVGLSALPASLLAGWLYTNVSYASPFYLGFIMSFLAIALLLLPLRYRNPS